MLQLRVVCEQAEGSLRSLCPEISSLLPRQAVTEGGSDAACHGPVPQAHFLHALGIAARLEALQRAAAPAEAAALRAGYDRSADGSRGHGQRIIASIAAENLNVQPLR